MAQALLRHRFVQEEATGLLAIGFIATLASLLGRPGPDLLFNLAAPVLGILFLVDALMGMWVDDYRATVSYALPWAGAVMLTVLGGAYVRSADSMRVVIAYFFPALCAVGAALVLKRAQIEERRARALRF